MAGVPTAVHYPVPLHMQPAYKDQCRVHGGVSLAEQLSARVMSLPMSADLDQTSQDVIVDAVRGAMK
jgi:UDP-2-acetamido-2-deoxy-ribo-hexuluronate aminotransferase